LELFARAAWADAGRVVLFGHSLGAMVAPLLAQRRPVAGIVTFGASAIPISEALVGAIARHAERQADPNARAWADQVSELIRLVVRGGRTPAEVFEERSDLARIAPKHFAGDQAYHRLVTFYRQLEAYNLFAAWRAWQGPTLLMHGALDFISTREDSRALAETLGPRARTLEFSGVDHQMSDAQSRQPPKLADTVSSALVAWLEALR
jgi:pimeloyl-ACP methyl ester carboxylesterase